MSVTEQCRVEEPSLLPSKEPPVGPQRRIKSLEGFRIAWVDETVEREAWRLLEQYRDVTLSLTDATTAVAARRARIGEIFGFDRDFEALGLLVLPGSARK